MLVLLFQAMRLMHIAAGATALGVFLVPLLARKGGRVHVTAGKVYVWAMGTGAASAAILTTGRLTGLYPGGPGTGPTLFLLFVTILAAACTWYGVRVLRAKKRTAVHRNPVDLAVSALLLAAGVAMALYGYRAGSTLLTYFPLVGAFLGGNQLYYWLRAPRERNHWWLEHMSGMFSAVIGTITAFVVFGGARLFGFGGGSPLLWFAPAAIMVPVLVVWQAYYRKRFARAPRAPGESA